RPCCLSTQAPVGGAPFEPQLAVASSRRGKWPARSCSRVWQARLAEREGVPEPDRLAGGVGVAHAEMSADDLGQALAAPASPDVDNQSRALGFAGGDESRRT